jgi:hypothetical protein
MGLLQKFCLVILLSPKKFMNPLIKLEDIRLLLLEETIFRACNLQVLILLLSNALGLGAIMIGIILMEMFGNIAV